MKTKIATTALTVLGFLFFNGVSAQQTTVKKNQPPSEVTKGRGGQAQPPVVDSNSPSTNQPQKPVTTQEATRPEQPVKQEPVAPQPVKPKVEPSKGGTVNQMPPVEKPKTIENISKDEPKGKPVKGKNKGKAKGKNKPHPGKGHAYGKYKDSVGKPKAIEKK